MKYDAQRTLTLASAFSEPRYPDTDGETVALDRLAVELTDAGWKVTHESRPGQARHIHLPNALSAIIIAVWLAIAAIGVGRSWPFFFFLALALRLLVPLAMGRRSPFSPTMTRLARGIEGGETVKTDLPQVILCTRVATPRRRFVGTARWVVAALVFGLAIMVATLPWCPSSGWSRGIQVVGWIALVIGLAFLGFEPIHNGGGPGLDDNRTGLALLIELARIWPKAARARVDIRFVGISGPCESKVVWPKPGPSLVIELINPGLGSLLSLGGTESTVKAACDAARDLWIPSS